MPYNPKSGYYYSTSAPLIAGGKIIVGGAVNDNYSTEEPSGVIRAFDVDTGALVWNWDSGNPDETTPLPAGQTYTTNSPNMLVDAERRREARPALCAARQPDAGPARHGPQRQCREILLLDHRARSQHRTSALGAPDRAPRPLGHGRAGAADAGRHHHGWTASCRRWSGRPSRATSTCSTGAAASRSSRSRKCRRRAARSRATTPRRRSRSRTSPSSPKPLTGADMWGVTMFDQLACRIELQRLRYEGRYTPPSRAGLADLSRQFRHLQLGRRRGRSGAAGDVRHADLSRLHVAARPARPGAAAGRRAGAASRGSTATRARPMRW